MENSIFFLIQNLEYLIFLKIAFENGLQQFIDESMDTLGNRSCL